MIRRYQQSLQIKLISIFALPLIAIFLFGIFYFSGNQRSAGRATAEQNVRLLSEMLAFSVGAGLHNSDLDLVQTAFDWARSDKSVVFILLLDESNNQLFEHNPQKLNYDLGAVLRSQSIGGSNDIVLTSKIIEYKGKKLGNVLVGVTLEPVLASINRQVMISSLVSLIILLSGMAVVIISARILVRDIKDIQQSIDSADLNTQFNSTRLDEMGQLQNSFDRFVKSIRTTITKVSESSAAVASASAEISASTEQMSSGAHEQTSQSEEVASAMNQMTKTILDNSKNAGRAAETARKARAAAEQGGQIVEQTIGGMKGIAEVVRTSAGTIQNLGKSSDQIGEIIQVIDDIADQTNLLALNAAIEAARAGEHGRGFAVVADEVRKLAEQTTKATKEIADMIKRIQSETQDAVQSMVQATHQVDSGISLADRAGLSLHEIVQISQEVTEMVHQIAVASEQQSTTSSQISRNVESIATVTQETAAGSEQIARTAEDLNRLTEMLESLVAQFKIVSGQQSPAKEPVIQKQIDAHQRSRYAIRKNGTLIRMQEEKQHQHS